MTPRSETKQPVHRVLLISYAFPPVGGAGVQRSVKFVKYLPDFGWQPTVLTVANPSVPVEDHDLSREVSDSLEVIRARTFEPSYRHKQRLLAQGSRRPSRVKQWVRGVASRLLRPDPQVLWNPAAYRAALRRLKHVRFDAVLVTGPPFSSMVLGRRLKQRLGLPLILDFRDEWTLSSRYLENRSTAVDSPGWERRMIRATLKSADAIIATTEASAAELTRQCRDMGHALTAQCIYNGFDPDDFRQLSSTPEPSEGFHLVYTGTLWNLTDVAPLVTAVELLERDTPKLARQLRLSFVGRRTAAQDDLLGRLARTGVELNRIEYRPHHESLQIARRSDALCLLLADQPGAERVVPGKLFEYLALERPILAVTPPGETAQLLSRSSRASVFSPSASRDIANWLARQIDSSVSTHRSSSDGQPGGNWRDAGNRSELAWCSRPALTGQLAEVLRRAANLPSR